MIEQGIKELLTSSTEFSAIAANRLYPLLLPTDSALPAATYNVVSVTPLYELTERVNFTKLRLQIDAWGTTYSDAKDLAAAIVDTLDNFSGLLPDGTQVFGVQLRNSTDDYEHEALTFRVLTEFNIQFAHSAS